MNESKDNQILQFSVSIASVLRQFNKTIPFLQPTYESIANSIEAGADEITVEFFTDNGAEKTVIGFEISDNGEGFTKKNTDAFFELWTENKASIGCKGSGRFTWLCVYNNVYIESYVASESRKVSIVFHRKFNGERDFHIEQGNVACTKTKIRFEGVTERYFMPARTKKAFDKRPIANLAELRENIIDYLLVPLFLKKKDGGSFDIRIKMNDEVCHILPADIPDLSMKEIRIHSSLLDVEHSFNLYYQLTNDEKDMQKAYYCSGRRPTKRMERDALGFEGSLPNRASLIVLLTSGYLDSAANDTRDGFESLSKLKQPDYMFPITWDEINRRVRECVAEIIQDGVPNLKDYNETQMQEALDQAPFLAQYIHENRDIIKDKENLIKHAEKHFQKDREETRERFERILAAKDIDQAAFVDSFNDMSILSAIELGAYIHYRQTIIDALNLVANDEGKKEDYLHKIFMPKRASGFHDNHYTLNNLWLLDDKFMTYAYACSDIEFEKIAQEIASSTGSDFETIKRKRPDMAILFNRKDGRRDGVVIEFKGANASTDEKCKAIHELPTNLLSMRDTDLEINTLWGYIITSFDSVFEYNLKSSGYDKRELGDGKSHFWQKYYEPSKAMVYVIDINAIASDALDRNSTFLGILKGGE